MDKKTQALVEQYARSLVAVAFLVPVKRDKRGSERNIELVSRVLFSLYEQLS